MAVSGTLNEFITQFKYGFVHPNLFRVFFTGLNTELNEYSKMLTTACKSATIPRTTFTESKYYHNGYYNKFVSGADYDAFDLIFYVDAGKTNSMIIDCFDVWNSLIYSDGKFGFKDDYSCDLEFQILNRNGTTLYSTSVVGVYPTNITAFELSSDIKTDIMTYTISFNFLKFK